MLLKLNLKVDYQLYTRSSQCKTSTLWVTFCIYRLLEAVNFFFILFCEFLCLSISLFGDVNTHDCLKQIIK